MLTSSFFSESLSIDRWGRARKRSIRRCNIKNASRHFYYLSCTHRSCGIWNTPMRGHRVTWPHRANLVCRVIADREDKIHLGRTRFRKFFPALAAQIGCWYSSGLKLAQCLRAHSPGWMAACAITDKLQWPLRIQDCLSRDRAGRVPGAQKQDVGVSWHSLGFTCDWVPLLPFAALPHGRRRS